MSLAHFVAAYLALRALVAGTAHGAGRAVPLHVAVAALAFPLFYTPLPGLLDGRPHGGICVAALNALLWGVAAWAVARRRAGPRRRPAARRGG